MIGEDLDHFAQQVLMATMSLKCPDGCYVFLSEEEVIMILARAIELRRDLARGPV